MFVLLLLPEAFNGAIDCNSRRPCFNHDYRALVYIIALEDRPTGEGNARDRQERGSRRRKSFIQGYEKAMAWEGRKEQ
jgi:hypothetical protein